MGAWAGKDGAVLHSTASDVVAYIDSWTLDQTFDVYDVGALGDDNKVYVGGMRATTAQISGTFDSTGVQTSFSDEIAGTPASHTVRLLYSSTGTDGWRGTAYINTQSVSAPKDGKVSFTAGLTFSGGIVAL